MEFVTFWEIEKLHFKLIVVTSSIQNSKDFKFFFEELRLLCPHFIYTTLNDFTFPLTNPFGCNVDSCENSEQFLWA